MTMTHLILRSALPVVVVIVAGCASTGKTVGTYNPTAKFAQAAPAQPMKITGSRIRTMASPDDASPSTTSPVSVITRREIEQRGEVNLAPLLMRTAPNMVRKPSER